MSQFRHFWRDYKGFVKAGVMFLVSIVVIISVVLPQMQAAIGMYEDIRDINVTLGSLKAKNAILGSIDEELVRKQLAELTAAVPPDTSLSAILLTIDRLSAKSGVGVSDITLSSPGPISTESAKLQTGIEKKIGSKLLPFSVTVRGPFAQVYGFFVSALQVRRLLRIAGFELHVKDSQDVSAILQMEAFYAPSLIKIGGINSPLTLLTDKEEAIIAKVSAIPLVAQEVVRTASSSPSTTTQMKADPFAP